MSFFCSYLCLLGLEASGAKWKPSQLDRVFLRYARVSYKAGAHRVGVAEEKEVAPTAITSVLGVSLELESLSPQYTPGGFAQGALENHGGGCVCSAQNFASRAHCPLSWCSLSLMGGLSRPAQASGDVERS